MLYRWTNRCTVLYRNELDAMSEAAKYVSTSIGIGNRQSLTVTAQSVVLGTIMHKYSVMVWWVGDTEVTEITCFLY